MVQFSNELNTEFERCLMFYGHKSTLIKRVLIFCVQHLDNPSVPCTASATSTIFKATLTRRYFTVRPNHIYTVIERRGVPNNFH